jgi:all-trans-retinol dehydrogenase (NAD+)
MTNLAGKRVLITGSASGIGRLMALKIAARGANLVLWDINLPALEELGDQLERWGYRGTTYLQCDLGDRDEIAYTAGRVLAEHGGVDVLINNAGIVSGKPLLELTDEAIERTFRVNTLALFWTTRAFLPGMIDKGEGHIVTIASAAGLVAAPKMTDYSSSKHAAVGFDDALRVELKRFGYRNIRTTVVCPFYIDTGMFKGVETRFRWLLPILGPDSATDKIVAAIEQNRQRLIMPPFVMVNYPGRLLPLPIFDRIAEIVGISKSMDDFTGRGE